MLIKASKMHSIRERTDLYSLRLFLAVVDLGSIAEAGRRNFIAPTAVTKRVQELEEAFGVQLLVRGSKGVSATAAGQALARHVRAMSNLDERMRSELNDYAAGVRGHVKLFANPSALVQHLADEIQHFIHTYPDIRVDLVEALSEQVVHAVRDGNADLGVFAAPVPLPAEIEVYPYRQDHLVAVVPQTHELASRHQVEFVELLQYPMIAVHGASSLAALLASASVSEIKPTFRVATNEVARWLVSKGLGITVLPEGLVAPYKNCLNVVGVPIKDAFATRHIMLCVRSVESLSASARTMFDALKQAGELTG
ncbi:LysR family transcriptional regulator [Paraburkholderia silviterrae]|uniref:LysR family transcriptional regulator n=1 Tax=Paraburkholderia silviterrae TaxID=2528715 RepID=A0A4R5M6J4_9BURK|nr:LysR family transcriptional regulator [Paraburkholderia silviterrae]TDG21741.1 LysR family transcriptional regulator [Paraburkholderia silviterrae]